MYHRIQDAPSFSLEPIRVLSPVFTVNVEAENQVQLTKLEKVLSVLAMEDPSLQVKNDEESGQLLLSGMGELHLEVLQQRLKREFGLEAYYSKMRVNYRETVSEKIDVDGEYVLIRDIMGEEIRLQGKIKMVDLANSIVELDCE